jgi:hypothetical protein
VFTRIVTVRHTPEETAAALAMERDDPVNGRRLAMEYLSGCGTREGDP